MINGTRQLVGSSAAEIRRAIDEESKRKRDARLSMRLDGVTVILNAQTKTPAELLLVIYDRSAVTKIARGENAGRTHTDVNIVRRIERLGTVTGTAERRFQVFFTGNNDVAAFLQDPKTMRIYAAASGVRSRSQRGRRQPPPCGL